jgi:uncharacterized protein
MNIPAFPELKAVSIDDKPYINDALWRFQPVTSELTFTNIFMWRDYYKFKWTVLDKCIFLFAGKGSDFFAMQPIGIRPFKNSIVKVLHWLREEHNQTTPHFDRIDKKTADEFTNVPFTNLEPLPHHDDYLYSTKSLIALAGRNFHSKRNHLTRFSKENYYNYQQLTSELIPRCLLLADHWCELYHCRQNADLCAEWNAIRETLTHFDKLDCKGGVIIVNGVVEAFSLGEMLNRSTAVIHIEKANTDIHGIYTAINQLFCKNAWSESEFVNREQDLGEPGLRAAKLSYHPKTMVEKFRISLIW